MTYKLIEVIFETKKGKNIKEIHYIGEVSSWSDASNYINYYSYGSEHSLFYIVDEKGNCEEVI